jgi:hypothetical protein
MEVAARYRRCGLVAAGRELLGFDIMLFCLYETCDDSDLLGIFVDLTVRIKAV